MLTRIWQQSKDQQASQQKPHRIDVSAPASGKIFRGEKSRTKEQIPEGAKNLAVHMAEFVEQVVFQEVP